VQYSGVDPILRIYQAVDQYIGRLHALAAADTTFIIMSDHGHGGNSDKAIFVNKWLEDRHLLRFKDTFDRKLFSAVFNLAKTLGVKTLPSSLKKMIFRRMQLASKIESSLRFSHIDWQHTKAYSEETPYYPPIWINVAGREPAGIVKPGKEYEEVREDIIEALFKWVDPETGQPLVRKVHKREEVYCGPWVERAPDLLIEWHLDQGYSYLFKNSGKIKETHGCSASSAGGAGKVEIGDHRDDGVLLIAGSILTITRSSLGGDHRPRTNGVISLGPSYPCGYGWENSDTDHSGGLSGLSSDPLLQRVRIVCECHRLATGLFCRGRGRCEGPLTGPWVHRIDTWRLR
jgi:predicted AlkP superfamily phosphohydrolase/phosphomutase